MSIFREDEPRPPEVQAVREVCIEAALERLDDLRRFYVDLLGLPPWPAERQIPGGWGVGEPRCGVYFQFRHDPFVHPARRRMVVRVAALESVEQRLVAAGVPCVRSQGLGYADRSVIASDPLGHLIELRTWQLL